MTSLDIVFVGLCAIVGEGEIDCQHPKPGGFEETEPFDVILFDPGLPHLHVPNLWVRVDGLTATPGECFLGTDEKPPEAGGTAAANCTDEPDKKWAMWSLQGKELRIIQEKTEKAELNRGRRKLGGRCWNGKKPGDNKSCKNPAQLDKCRRDVSWVPEFAKASGEGRVRQAMLDNPASDPRVGAILRDLRGVFEAQEPGGDPWMWEWNHPGCGRSVPSYEQSFARSATIRDVKSSADAIYLIDLYGSSETEIKVSGSPKVVVRNLPPGPVKTIEVGDRCYVPHFDSYKALLESAPVCRRVPYVAKPMAGCPELVGIIDPFCPPTVFGRVKGGR